MIGLIKKIKVFFQIADATTRIGDEAAPDMGLNIDDRTMEFYERVYFSEIDIREKIVARMQVSLAVLVPILGVQSYFFGAVDTTKTGPVIIIFWAALFVAFFLALCAGYLFFQVLTGHTYRFIPLLRDFEKYRYACAVKFKGQDGADEWLEHWVTTTFRGHLMQHYVVCASHNFEVNADRSNRSWRAHSLLLYGTLATGLVAMIFWFGQLKVVTADKVDATSTVVSSGTDVIMSRSIGQGLDLSSTYSWKSKDEHQ